MNASLRFHGDKDLNPQRLPKPTHRSIIHTVYPGTSKERQSINHAMNAWESIPKRLGCRGRGGGAEMEIKMAMKDVVGVWMAGSPICISLVAMMIATHEEFRSTTSRSVIHSYIQSTGRPQRRSLKESSNG